MQKIKLKINQNHIDMSRPQSLFFNPVVLAFRDIIKSDLMVSLTYKDSDDLYLTLSSCNGENISFPVGLPITNFYGDFQRFFPDISPEPIEYEIYLPEWVLALNSKREGLEFKEEKQNKEFFSSTQFIFDWSLRHQMPDVLEGSSDGTVIFRWGDLCKTKGKDCLSFYVDNYENKTTAVVSKGDEEHTFICLRNKDLQRAFDLYFGFKNEKLQT